MTPKEEEQYHAALRDAQALLVKRLQLMMLHDPELHAQIWVQVAQDMLGARHGGRRRDARLVW